MKSEGISSQPALAGKSLRTAIREAIRQSLDLNIYNLFLFGSEASGTADRSSDIDIGILGPQPVPAAVLQRIREDLGTMRALRLFYVGGFRPAGEVFKREGPGTSR